MANTSQQISTVTADILKLELKSNLNPTQLQLVKNIMGVLQYNQYAATLYVLVNGPTSLGTYIVPKGIPNSPGTLIDQEFLQKVWALQYTYTALQCLALVTPAGRKGFFKQAGDVGVSSGLNPQTQASHPIYGEPSYLPPLLQHALQKVKNKYFDATSKYIKHVKTHTYMAAAKSTYGSLEQIALVIDKVNELCSSLQHLLMDIYRGVIQAVRIFIAYINGLMNMIQQYINNLIEQIIPAELLCLVLQVLQFFIKDIGTYTAVFSHVISLDYLRNILNQYTAKILAFIPPPEALDPLTYIPAEYKWIFAQIQAFVSNPKAYAGNAVRNMAYNYTLQNLQHKFVAKASVNFSSNVSFAGPYTMANNTGLLDSMFQNITKVDDGFYDQPGTEDSADNQTNRYAEKMVPVPNSSYLV